MLEFSGVGMEYVKIFTRSKKNYVVLSSSMMIAVNKGVVYDDYCL